MRTSSVIDAYDNCKSSTIVRPRARCVFTAPLHLYSRVDVRMAEVRLTRKDDKANNTNRCINKRFRVFFMRFARMFKALKEQALYSV